MITEALNSPIRLIHIIGFSIGLGLGAIIIKLLGVFE